jgi:uncharacterized membrane protein
LDEFFSKNDLFDLTGILKHIEQTTRCDVVVRITSDKVMPEETARWEFVQLGLDRSEEKTGLLLYINLFHRKFIFLAGDEIIDKLGERWLVEYAEMLGGRFRRYQFGFGLHDVIARIGVDLKKHFPTSAPGISG